MAKNPGAAKTYRLTNEFRFKDMAAALDRPPSDDTIKSWSEREAKRREGDFWIVRVMRGFKFKFGITKEKE